MTFEPLSDNTTYTLFMMLSNEEPSSLASFDPEIYKIKFKIDKKWDIPDIHGSLLHFSNLLIGITILMFLI